MGIQTIGYAFSVSSGQKASHATPGIIEQVLFPFIGGRFGVNKNFVNVKARNEESPEQNRIQNYASVKESLENLCEAQCRAMWNGDKPLTIGGDHSQGFATVKSSLFTEVLKAVKDGRIKCTDGAGKNELLSLADNNRFLDAAAKLEKLTSVRPAAIRVSDIKKITESVEVVWVDSHGDFNHPGISPSGNFHGMSLAAACGVEAGGIEKMLCSFIHAQPRNVHVVCARDLDEKEISMMSGLKVDFAQFEMTGAKNIRNATQPVTIELPSLKQVITKLVDKAVAKGRKIIFSLDVDHIDGVAVPDTGTAQGLPRGHSNFRPNLNDESPRGPSAADSYEAFSAIAKNPNVIAIDISEAAAVHHGADGIKAGTRTIETAMKLTVSVIGGSQLINRLGTVMKKYESEMTHQLRELVRTAVTEVNSWRR